MEMFEIEGEYKKVEHMNIFEFVNLAKKFNLVFLSKTPVDTVYEVMHKYFLPLIEATNVTVGWNKDGEIKAQIASFNRALQDKLKNLEHIYKILYGVSP